MGGVNDFFADPVEVIQVDGFGFFLSKLFVGGGVGEVVKMDLLNIFL